MCSQLNMCHTEP